jgi:hypothetical protein
MLVRYRGFVLISYTPILTICAAIQGKDCLVQKFRNSSVMLEHPSFRPKVRNSLLDASGVLLIQKIFILGDAPHGGMEDEFPGPDNASKMRRSVENAEHVGMYYNRTY